MANTDESVIVSRVSDVRNLSSTVGRAEVKPRTKVEANRRKKIAMSSMNLKTSNSGYGGMGGTFGGAVSHGQGTNIYSPHISPDFLELPQNRTEKRSYFRHFYNNDPYVGQAIDLHTDLPLSKIRLTLPKGSDPRRNRKILNFFQDMTDRINLLQVLKDATREYYVIGEAFIFAEDTPVEVPEEIYYKFKYEITAEGDAVKKKVRRDNWRELAEEYKKNHYKGWKKLVILPPDQVKLSSFQFSDEDIIELIPDSKTANLVQKAMQGDPQASKQFLKIPPELRQYLESGENIPLGTDPYEGSFVYHLARSKPSYQTHGVSILQRCLRTLVYRDKLRQAQTSIASRAMTPKRLIYAEDLDVHDVEELRDQVDLALMDPDFSIITNYEVRWEEISADSRLLNLSGEYDMTDRQLFAGLGITKSMLTGDSGYGAEKINLEIINNRYLLYRDHLQRYIEEKVFKPIARKKGFVEKDEFGNEVLLYPKLSFTRLAVRDNRDTFDSLFNLYQKGSLSVNYILELFNLDPDAVREQIQEDLFTVNDPMFNEAIRGIMSEVGRSMNENSNFVEKFVEYLGKITQFDLRYQEPEEDGGRF